jgi:hypothetical protein
MFTENTKENKDRLEALKEYFTVNFLLNNIEYMKDKSEHVVFDVKPGNVYSGVDTVKLDDGTKRDVYYDTKIEVTEANEESNIFDKFIKGFNNTLLIRLDVDGITEDGKRFVYYKEYGKKHFHGYYYYNPEMISSWNLDDVLFPFAKVVSVYDNTKTTFWMSQNTKDQPQIGDIIVLRRYSDLIRQDLRTGKIIDRKDEQGKIIYTLDKNVKVNIDNVNDNNNIDDIAEETDTEKKCIT